MTRHGKGSSLGSARPAEPTTCTNQHKRLLCKAEMSPSRTHHHTPCRPSESTTPLPTTTTRSMLWTSPDSWISGLYWRAFQRRSGLCYGQMLKCYHYSKKQHHYSNGQYTYRRSRRHPRRTKPRKKLERHPPGLNLLLFRRRSHQLHRLGNQLHIRPEQLEQLSSTRSMRTTLSPSYSSPANCSISTRKNRGLTR